MDKIKLLDELKEIRHLIDLIVEIDTNPDYVRDTKTDLCDEPYDTDNDFDRSWNNVMSMIEYFCNRVEYIGDELDDLMNAIRDDVEIIERQPIKPAPGQLPLF